MRIVFEERDRNVLIITIYLGGKEEISMKMSYDGEGDTLSILISEAQIDQEIPIWEIESRHPTLLYKEKQD
ncbi:MAG: hypothetical protein ACE5Z5_00215 [Candidatus Bathyarchaeia archaeon]